MNYKEWKSQIISTNTLDKVLTDLAAEGDTSSTGSWPIIDNVPPLDDLPTDIALITICFDVLESWSNEWATRLLRYPYVSPPLLYIDNDETFEPDEDGRVYYPGIRLEIQAEHTNEYCASRSGLTTTDDAPPHLATQARIRHMSALRRAHSWVFCSEKAKSEINKQFKILYPNQSIINQIQALSILINNLAGISEDLYTFNRVDGPQDLDPRIAGINQLILTASRELSSKTANKATLGSSKTFVENLFDIARINDIEFQLICAAGILIPFLASEPQPDRNLSHMTRPQPEPQHTPVEPISIKMQITQAISELGYAPDRVIYCDPEQEQEVIENAKQAFLTDPSCRFWWTCLKKKTRATSYDNYKEWVEILSAVLKKHEGRCWLIQLEGGDAAYDIQISDTIDLISACAPFEYALVAKDYTWLICDTHHDQIVEALPGFSLEAVC